MRLNRRFFKHHIIVIQEDLHTGDGDVDMWCLNQP